MPTMPCQAARCFPGKASPWLCPWTFWHKFCVRTREEASGAWEHLSACREPRPESICVRLGQLRLTWTEAVSVGEGEEAVKDRAKSVLFELAEIRLRKSWGRAVKPYFRG